MIDFDSFFLFLPINDCVVGDWFVAVARWVVWKCLFRMWGDVFWRVNFVPSNLIQSGAYLS